MDPPTIAPPDAADIKSVAKTLKRAKMPILFVESSVIHADACEELRQLAEKLNAPVIVTRCAKGVLREDHPLALRNSNGFLARQGMQIADCTLAIGSRFTSIDTRDWSFEPTRLLIQIDADETEIGREYPCDVNVVGDLKLTLQALIEEVEISEDNWNQPLNRLREKFATQLPMPIRLTTVATIAAEIDKSE